MDPTSIAVGAAAGAAIGDVYEKVKDTAKGATGNDIPEHGPIELHMLVDLVADIHKAIKEVRDSKSPPTMKTVILSVANPYELKRNGYNHVSILCSSAFTVNVETVIGNISFALNTGWNAFDLPDNTMVSLPTGNALQVVIRWGEDSLDIAGV